MTNTTNIEVDTRPAAGAESVKTNLTVNWEGMEADDIRALAQQALIVKLQGKWRKDGIPNGDHTVNAVEYKIGVRAKREPQTLEQMLAKCTPEQIAAALAKLGLGG